jgi:hypothetical protein
MNEYEFDDYSHLVCNSMWFGRWVLIILQDELPTSSVQMNCEHEDSTFYWGTHTEFLIGGIGGSWPWENIYDFSLKTVL